MNPELFGVHYYHSDRVAVYHADVSQLYFFSTYIGHHQISVEKGDCIYYLDDVAQNAHVKKGPCNINSQHVATVIRGYMHPDASASLAGVTTLPYVNGCSTKQIFPPIRPGDPTWQYLRMPPFSHEQDHHIHSTFRIVFVAHGKGKSVVGLKEKSVSTELYPGMVCIFEPMAPHHFETETEDGLIALPLHIYSSVGPSESNHPMYNGTVRI